jgi:hypothetical protein
MKWQVLLKLLTVRTKKFGHVNLVDIIIVENRANLR